ncbi:hypothetical protein FRB99_004045 [Tulasnella sp. 403]|nr:hypothetical protein FRB99_004045 [Tulasnella sp. 403]
MHSNRDRHADPLARLRFAIETMPGSRKYQFTPSTRLEVLHELYSAFWGPYMDLFLPQSYGALSGLLSEAQKAAYPDHNEFPIPGKPCGRIFKKGDSCYRCRDCAIDDSSVLCAPCFHSSDHAGHNVTFYIAVQPGGVCDCGEVEAWKVPFQCRHHPPLDPSAQPTPKTNPTRTAPIVDSWTIRNRATVPHELRDYMSRTVAYALDFVLDTLDFSPSELSYPSTEADLKKLPTADPLGNDLFAIVVWNDEKHSFDEGISHIRDSIGCSMETAVKFTNQIDSEGRAVVDVSATIPRLLTVAKQIAGIEMGVTVRRAYDTFREQVSAVIIEWLMDLMQCRLLNDSITLREVVAAEFYAPRKKDSSSLTSNQEATKVLAEIKDPARLHWLFLYHAKLWKRVRQNLKRVMVSMLTINHEHRLTVAIHFASVYHRIIDTYLLVDREAESSIKYFSVQIFTVPSVAAYITRHQNIISRLLSIITSFFTNNIQNKRIIHPPDLSRRVEVDSYPFKSKRFMPVFSDLRYICTNRTIQELIAHNHDFIAQFIPVCQIFMGINSNKRAATSHVEYETESWISVFNVTLSLSRVVKVYGEAFAHASASNLVYAVSAVIHAILSTCTLSNDQLDKTKYSPIAFHSVQFGDAEYHVIQFDVLSQWVSFHHSLHWLLAELFKHIHLLSESSLSQMGMKSLRDMILRNASERAVLTVIDFPLRVVTMVAQIRTGLWVRNGFAIRGQLLHYRDFMLRELCYDQDLYILQSAFVILDPNVVFVSILDRFQLTQWFSGDMSHTVYDGPQTFSMVEEFLYILITCASEFANARKLTPLEVVRREIIHGLALGPCSFTELCKRVAERIVDDANLDRALSLVAKYRAPSGPNDYGTYELKEEMFEEVNPFFFHYTRNRREEAEAVLKTRLVKAQGGQKSLVVVPKPMNVQSGPFTTLNMIFCSEVLGQIVFYSLWNVYAYTESSGSIAGSADAIMDQALHLVMIGLVERPEDFSRVVVEVPFKDELTILQVLCKLEFADSFKSFKGKIQWCLDCLAGLRVEEVKEERKVPSSGPAMDTEEAKKKAAKARQAMIMQQFAAAQKTFLDQYEDDDEDDEDEAEGTTTPSKLTEPLGPCIVCQDELDTSQSFGVLGFIQPSRIIKRMPEPRAELLTQLTQIPSSLDRPVPPALPSSGPRFDLPEDVAPFGVAPSEETRFGLYGSVCGHLMHLECFKVYSSSIEQRHTQQPTRNHPEVVERKEFLCPLCKSLGNIVIPVVPKPIHCDVPNMPFWEWLRKSKTELLAATEDRLRDSLMRPQTGEFACWSAEDKVYSESTTAQADTLHHIVETLDNIIRPLSAQTPHLRDRPDPPLGKRGRGIYLPEEFVAYTINCIEIAQRGVGEMGKFVCDNVNESTVMRLIRGLLAYLTRRSQMEFTYRSDKGRRGMYLGILKRLLTDGTSREKLLTSPLLLRDPFTLLVEVAAVAPEMLGFVTVLGYYACLARTAIGLVDFLNPIRNGAGPLPPGGESVYADIFGEDVSVFVLSVCRHSVMLEQAAEVVLQHYGNGRIEQLMYAHTLPFLRCALLLQRAVLPPPNTSHPDPSLPEYRRLLHILGIPPLADISLPQFDSLRNTMLGWCSHYGLEHATAPKRCGIVLDLPDIHRLARLPDILDSVFIRNSDALVCQRCETIPTDPAVCGGAVGMYFLVKRSMILYLYAGSGSFSQSPYLDVHGEFDYMMRRGRRQYLHPSRYEEIRKTWLSHGIPTFTARKLDGTIDSGGWDTV